MLSLIVITKNEEANLARCLESVPFADEIIVVDSGSTDNTVAIAKQFTDKVLVTDWQGYGIQKQRALAMATGDWVLTLDADESLSPELQISLPKAIASNKADGYRIPIRMIFYDKLLKYSASPTRHIRLFKRKDAHYSLDIVHEKIIVPSNYRIKRLKQPIKHHSFKDLSHALYKLNQYSSYSAKIKIESKKRGSFIKTLLGSFWMFHRCLILQGGFLDGKAGVLFAFFSAQGTFYRGLKQIYPDNDLYVLPDVNKRT